MFANCVVWARYKVYRMLDLVARGAGGHGPVHLLLGSAAEIGFAWDGGEQGWLGVALPLLRMLAGLVQPFVLQFCRLGSYGYYSACSLWGFSGGSVR